MEVIEVVEREVEVIEILERGLVGPTGPVGPQANINYTVVSSSQAVTNRQMIAADTSAGSFTLTLPSNPANGDAIDIFDYSDTFDTNPLTIARNGQPIEGLADDLVANVEGAYFTLIFTGGTRGWQVVPRYGVSGLQNVLTTEGDLLYRGASAETRLGIGTAGQILKVNSGATAPEWGNEVMSSADKTKLDGIAAGAEVNVQANWTESNNALDSFILNKPATFTPSSHTHGNITNDGKVGSTSGLPVITTTDGAVTTLALGTANQVLRVNSGATGVEFGAGFDAASPPAIGNTTPAAGTFTTLNASTTLNVTTAGSTAAETGATLTHGRGSNLDSVRLLFYPRGAANTSANVEFNCIGSTGPLAQMAIRCNNNERIRLALSNPDQSSAGVVFAENIALASGGTMTSPDVVLFRDGAANILGLRNAASAQTFRIYGQITGTDVSATGNYERGFMRWSSAGGTFQIGTEKGSGGGAARALEFQTDGVTRLTIQTGGTIVTSGVLNVGSTLTVGGAGNIQLPSSQLLFWLNRGVLASPADGQILLQNNAGTDFNRLHFGGTTSSFPALKRSSTTLQVRLANDSGFAPLAAGLITATGNLVLTDNDGPQTATFDAQSKLTANRTYDLPDASGTIALTTLIGAPCEFIVACSDEATNLTTGTAKVTFRAPYAFTLTAVRASVNTAPTGSTLIVDINEGGTTVLSTKLSIDASEKTSTTAASAAVISDSAIADDAEITIDIDQIGSTIAGKGLKVALIGTRA